MRAIASCSVLVMSLVLLSEGSSAQQYRTTYGASSYPTIGPNVVQQSGVPRPVFQNSGPPVAQSYRPIYGPQQSVFPTTGPQAVQPSGTYRMYNNTTTPA